MVLKSRIAKIPSGVFDEEHGSPKSGQRSGFKNGSKPYEQLSTDETEVRFKV